MSKSNKIPTTSRKIKYGVIGLGWFGQEAILPAFANATENSELAVAFSSDADKRAFVKNEYGVETFDYPQLEEVLQKGEIDAVFIAVPNVEHRDFTIRAAEQGVHVLCEKPLAESSASAREMIEACERNDVKLMTGYRLHFQPANMSVVEQIKADKIGTPRFLYSVHSMNVKEGNSRLDGNLKQDPLRDLGIYCINSARYLFQDEPVEVVAFSASSDDPRFREVPEMISAILRFPQDRLASFTCSFGSDTEAEYRVAGTKGDIHLCPAFTYHADAVRTTTVDQKSQEQTFKLTDQISAEIVYFSKCILDGTDPVPSGEAGLIDLIIIEAIEESIGTGSAVKIHLPINTPQPDKSTEIHRPSPIPPKSVDVKGPG